MVQSREEFPLKNKHHLINSAKIRLIDILLIVISIHNVILNELQVTSTLYMSYLRIAIVMIVMLFLPGWVLERLLNFPCKLPVFDLIVLSFPISIGITALIFTSILFLPITHRNHILTVIYLCFALLLLLKVKARNELDTTTHQPLFGYKQYIKPLIETLLLTVLSVIFISIILNLYPKMAYRAGEDVVLHFSHAKLLALAPDIYTGNVIWFHAVWAAVAELSKAPYWLFQSSFAVMSLMLIFSFYIMAKEYLRDINPYLPLLATIFFFSFSGFGWTYWLKKVLELKRLGLGYETLRVTDIFSYWDTSGGSGSSLAWLYFRPLTVGSIILCILFYLIKCNNLSKKQYLILTSFLIVILTQLHIAELFIFTAMLLILAIAKPNTNLWLRDAFIANMLGSLISIIIFIINEKFFGITYYTIDYRQAAVLAILALIGIALTKWERRLCIRINQGILEILISLILGLYVSLIGYWLVNAEDLGILHFAKQFNVVPWHFYPMLLGVGCLLVILNLKYIIKNREKEAIIVFLSLLITVILAGKIIGYINVNIPYLYIAYSERRMIFYSYISTSILAPIIILKMVSSLKKNYRRILVAVLIFLIVISGSLSTMLAIHYQDLLKTRIAVRDNELKLLGYANSLDPHSVVLTTTTTSQRIARFIPAQLIIDSHRNILWPAKSPELVLNNLFSLSNSAVLFLTNRDLSEISRKYNDGYLAQHLLYMGTPIYQGPLGKIILLNDLFPPSSTSDVILVIPEITKFNYRRLYYAYHFLSSNKINYTTAILPDINTLKEAKTLVIPTEEVASEILKYNSAYKLNFSKLVVFNLNGYGSLSRELFQFLNIIKEADVIGKGNLTLMSLLPSEHTDSVPLTIENTIFNITTINLISPHSLELTGWMLKNITRPGISYWKYLKRFQNPANLSSFDFITFNWYGSGDNKKFTVYVITSWPNDYFWYQFEVSWTGWKTVVLPMRTENYSLFYNGVKIHYAIKGKPSWSNITRIEIMPSSDNPNVKYNNNMDKFTLEQGIPVGIRVKLLNVTKSFANNYLVKIYLPYDVPLENLFGNTDYIKINYTETDHLVVLEIKVKLPPSCGNESSISIRIFDSSSITSTIKHVITQQQVTLPLNVTTVLLQPLQQNRLA